MAHNATKLSPGCVERCQAGAVIFGLLLTFSPGIGHAQSRGLTFVKEIGVGWPTDKYGWMSFVSFSPDGTMVASDDPTKPDDLSGNLALWTFPEGRLIRRLPVKPAIVSRDWKYLASYDAVTKMETGKAFISLGETAWVRAFSPDSRYVAEVSGRQVARNSRIRIVELASGKQVSAFGTIDPNSIAMSPDGVTLAAGYWDVVTLWNMITGQRLTALQGFGDDVGLLAFSPDGKLLAAGTTHGLQIWDVSSLVRVESINLDGSLSDAQFSPDGRLIAVGAYGIGTVFLIDVGSGKMIDRQRVSDMGCGSVAFSPDGRFLITPSTGGLIKWPYDKGGTIRVFSVHAP
jgi:WD40 repeat protein